MKNLNLTLFILMFTNIITAQNIENLDYCKTTIKIDQVSPTLNGNFEKRFNGKVVESGSFINGEKNGEWLTYSIKGNLIRKINYVNGLLDGKVELYYTNGKKELDGEFNSGKKVGKWTYYTEKGKVWIDGDYISNKPINTWTIKDINGKKTLVQYDYNTKKYIENNTIRVYKDADYDQNMNTEEWYVLYYPNLQYSSKTEPLGGFSFGNSIFIKLVEIPNDFWDTFLYQSFKVVYTISDENEATIKSEYSITKEEPDNSMEFTFLIDTNPIEKIKKIEFSALQKKLLEYKINEALNLLPPWVYNGNSTVELYVHYVINVEKRYKK